MRLLAATFPLNHRQVRLTFRAFQTISICRFEKQRIEFPMSKSGDSIRRELNPCRFHTKNAPLNSGETTQYPVAKL